MGDQKDFEPDDRSIDLILSDECSLGYLLEYPRVNYNEHDILDLSGLDTQQRKAAARHVYGFSHEVIESFKSKNSGEDPTAITQVKGVFGVWSDQIDWLFGFKDHNDARQFVIDHLL